jgi:hypothetical protein
LIWTYLADSLVDTPPTYYEGKLLFGSRDGWITCLLAKTGELCWRYRVAPSSRQIMINGKLESAWPIHGSITVYKGRAYVLAGHSSFLDGGLVLHSLDPHSGKQFAVKRLSSQQIREKEFTNTPVKPELIVEGADGIYIRTQKINPEDLSLNSTSAGGPTSFFPRNNDRPVQVLCSTADFLDDDYFNRSYLTFGGQARGDLLVVDDQSIYGFRAYTRYWGQGKEGKKESPGTSHKAKGRHYVVGSGGYSLFCKKRLEFAPVKKNTRGHKESDADFVWQQTGLPRILAMTVTADSLIIAGIPDVVGEDNPWAAFDGELGGILQIRDKKTGELRQEIKLEAPPVFNGIAVTEGQLIISLKYCKVLSIKKKIKSEKL